jgi:hypothetical protein
MSIDLVVCENYKGILEAMMATVVVPLRIDFEMSFLCKFLSVLDPNAELRKSSVFEQRGLGVAKLLISCSCGNAHSFISGRGL